MLLGSGELSRELAIALRHLGAEVIAADDRIAGGPTVAVGRRATVAINGCNRISW